MIIITGGAGFIGSNIVNALCKQKKEVVVVDDFEDHRKYENLLEAINSGYVVNCMDYRKFEKELNKSLKNYNRYNEENPTAIIHQGAISSTTHTDGNELIENNVEFSKKLAKLAARLQIPFIYASSASVYGSGTEGAPNKESHPYLPLNMYGFSKSLLDSWVQQQEPPNSIIGLRYFNVYGPGEQFKGSQASPFFRYYKALKQNKNIELLSGPDGFGTLAEDTHRDFVYVDDVVDVVLWCLRHLCHKGVYIYNVGSSYPRRFSDVAYLVREHFDKGMFWNREIKKIKMPGHLLGRTQTYTQADLTTLRAAGYEKKFLTIEEGSQKYFKWLDENFTCRWE